MKQAASLLVLWLLTGGAGSAIHPHLQQTVIRGVVVDAVTNAPLPEVRVTLQQQRTGVIEITTYGPRIEPADPRTLVITDTTGRFQFVDVEPGVYALSASRRGYEDEGTDYFQVAAETTSRETNLRLTATAKVTGSVSGRVWNSSNGRPIAGISVRLLRRIYSAEGDMYFEEGAAALTNDLGEYRLYWVRPGRYILVAGDPERRATWNENVVPSNYGSVFYPGARNLDKASTLRIQPGSMLTGMDFALERPATYRIRGTLVDSATGKPPQGARLQMTFFGLSASVGSGRVHDAATGAFDIPDLLPGTYELEAWVNSAATEDRRTASAHVVIANANVDGVVLTFANPSTDPREISGRILVEGDLPSGSDLKRIGVRVQLMPPALGDPVVTADAAADGTFKLKNVSGGESRVGIAWMPQGFYLKEARLDGADALNQPRVFSHGGELQLVLSSSGGQIEGRALDDNGQPVEHAAVVLIPDAGRKRVDLYKREFTGKDGSFKIVGIAPGEYKLFAWENLDEHEYFDPEFMKPFEDKAATFRVMPSSRQVLALNVLPAGEDR